MKDSERRELLELAEDWLLHWEYNETDDPANDTGGENFAYNSCGERLKELVERMGRSPE